MVTIKECGEPLVNLLEVCPRILPAVDDWRLEEDGGLFLREGVANMMKTALESLPGIMTFRVYDAWRPVSFQKRLTSKYKSQLKTLYPDWSNEKILKEVREYVAPYKGKEASGHLTGGAIDLIICQDGKSLPLRKEDLKFQDNAESYQTDLPDYIKKNRKMMFDILTHAGLTNYPKEYWHWCYGDTLWARLNNKDTAIYGIVNNIPKNN